MLEVAADEVCPKVGAAKTRHVRPYAKAANSQKVFVLVWKLEHKSCLHYQPTKQEFLAARKQEVCYLKVLH